MREKHQLKPCPMQSVRLGKNVNIIKVSGLDVRLRIVSDRAANVHSGADSDELFCCLEGIAHLDTSDGSSVALKPHELAVVLRNTSHQLRVKGSCHPRH